MSSIKKIFLGLLVLNLTGIVFAEKFFICLGSYKQKDNANDLVEKLSEKDISAVILESEIDGSIYNRVLYNKEFSEINTARNNINIIDSELRVNGFSIDGLWTCKVADDAIFSVPEKKLTIKPEIETEIIENETVESESFESEGAEEPELETDALEEDSEENDFDDEESQDFED